MVPDRHDLPSLANLRGAWLEIDLAAYRHNVAAMRRWLAPHTHLMAVIKADGYGAGALPLARVAVEAGADRLAVATVGEGIRLRQAGIRHPILLLSLVPAEAWATALRNGLELTMSAPADLEALATTARESGLQAPVHLKVDTGMARVGTEPGAVGKMLSQVLGTEGLDLVGLSSHLASADDPDPASMRKAQESFRRVVLAHAWPAGTLRHLANSAATLRAPECHWDMVRPGLLLHGLVPGVPVPSGLDLRPVWTLRARLMQVRSVSSGTRVGYGERHTVDAPTRLGVLPVGYADGLPRSLEGRAQVLVGGRPRPIVGAISMDQVVADLGPGDLAEFPVGTEAVLVGRQGAATLDVADLARDAGTIPYEILTGFGRRLPRVYLGT
ncbi:MAG: alanine racemase [Candidatus Sericytochromatia bacterium]|nr:alanine racemase [Candidatus Sericytochromatia bacterium]